MCKANKHQYTTNKPNRPNQMTQIAQTMFLGLLQGLTEWLPISSTAHLRLAEQFLNLTTTPLFNLTLHAATLTAVILYFRTDVAALLKALVHLDFHSEDGKLIPLLIIATAPTAAIGLLYVTFLEDAYQTTTIIAITFLVGAALLYASKTAKENNPDITLKTALLMGTAQGLATFPGLSRSGATISTALLTGLKREKAFRFSFLLSIPAILGDLAVEAYKQRLQLTTQQISPPELLAALVIAAATGYIAIRIVSKTVTSKKFHYFAAYTATLGITLLILTLKNP